MARWYAIFWPQFWTGETGRLLRSDPDSQRIAAYLITAPTSNMIGLYNLPLPTLCHEVGIPLQGAVKALRRVAEVGFAHYDAPSEWVWVCQMAAYQLGEQLKPKDNRILKVVSLLHEARKSPFAKDFYAKYRGQFCLPEIDLGEGPSKPLRSQEQEQEQELDQEQERDGGDPPTPRAVKAAARRPAFEPPTVAEIAAYCSERNNGIDAEQFYAHYDANGWVQGKGKPIRNWKSAIVTWEKNREHGTAPVRANVGRDASDPRGNLALRERLLAEVNSNGH